MKLLLAGIVPAALCSALSVYASLSPGEAWVRYAVSKDSARLLIAKDAASAFEQSGIPPKVTSLARYNNTGAASWSPDGRFLAITTYETEDTMGSAEPPGVWLLDGLDGEPIYFREGAFLDVALVGNGGALLTVSPGSPRRVEWAELHKDGVPSPVRLPEGFEAESVSVAGNGKVFAVRGGKETCVGRLDAPTEPTCFPVGLHRVDLSHDGSRLVGVEGSAVTLRDAKTGKLRARQPSEKNSPLAVSRDGARFAYLRSGKLVVARSDTGAAVAQFAIVRSEEDEWGPMTAIALDESGERVALLDSMGQLEVTDLEGVTLAEMLVHYGVAGFEVQNQGPLAFAPDGEHLHAASNVVSISKRDLVRDGEAGTPPFGGRGGLRFSEDATHLGSEYFYYSLKDNRESTQEEFDAANRVVEVSADGRFRVTWSDDVMSLRLRDTLRPDWGPVVWKRSKERWVEPITRLLPDRVTLLIVAPSENRGDTIYLVDLRTGEVAQEIQALSGCRSETIELSEEGRRMVLECTGKPYLWDFVSARPKQLSEEYIQGLAFADASHAVFTEEKGRVLLALGSGERKVISPPTAGLNCRGQSVRGKAVTCHEDGLRVWDRAKELGRIQARADDVNFWSFAPHNNVVLHFTERTEIHSLDTNTLVATIRHRVVTAPDGSFQVVGSVPKLRCRYGNYVLPYEVCSERFQRETLLQQIFR